MIYTLSYEGKKTGELVVRKFTRLDGAKLVADVVCKDNIEYITDSSASFSNPFYYPTINLKLVDENGNTYDI